jgi:hypothetical protein
VVLLLGLALPFSFWICAVAICDLMDNRPRASQTSFAHH